MTLHSPIQTYFDADKDNNSEAVLRAFAPGAIVEDENRSYVGHEAIGAWWRETKAKYQTVIEPFEASEENDVTRVRAKVTGRFPSSPTTLIFAFRLKGGQIANLDIRP